MTPLGESERRFLFCRPYLWLAMFTAWYPERLYLINQRFSSDAGQAIDLLTRR
jgi:hypothetical protein